MHTDKPPVHKTQHAYHEIGQIVVDAINFVNVKHFVFGDGGLELLACGLHGSNSVYGILGALQRKCSVFHIKLLVV